jgi:hypothetical protein
MSKMVLGGCLTLMVCLAGLAGCSTKPGLGLTAHEREHRHNLIRDRDRAALQDDVDMMLLRDRGSRLTRWHVR